ncbi:MAG: hypothetical protein PHX70_01885 [Clostridium sp.]|nr:hypothetical protein [Clostridium sp.]
MCKKIGLILIVVSLICMVGCASNNSKGSNKQKDKKKVSSIIQQGNNDKFKVSKYKNNVISNSKTKESNKKSPLKTKNVSNKALKSNNEDKQVTYKTYSNIRYGYNIDYPDNFAKNAKFDSDEGMILQANDGKANIRVWGGNNVNNYNPSEYYRHVLKNQENIYYKAQSGKWFVLSWKDGQNIEYEMYVVGEKSEDGYLIEYPESEKKYYDNVIKQMDLSFKTPFVDESR